MLLTLHIVCLSDEDAVSSQEEEADEDEAEHAEDLVDQRWARARCASFPVTGHHLLHIPACWHAGLQLHACHSRMFNQ